MNVLDRINRGELKVVLIGYYGEDKPLTSAKDEKAELLRLARLGASVEKAHNKVKGWEFDYYGLELFHTIEGEIRAEKGAE